MRILLSTDTAGGVWSYTETLAARLHAHGHEVLLAALGEPTAQQRAALPRAVQVEARHFRLEWMPHSSLDGEAAGAWLSETARRFGADVVHLNQMSYAVHDFGAPTLVVVHSDVLSWYSEVRGTRAPREWNGYADAVRRGIEAADLVVAPTEYQSALTLRHFGRVADRVIHNGVRAGRDPATRACPLLVSAGRAWDDAKGMRTFDEAVGLLGAEAPPAHLLGEERGPNRERFSARHLICHGQVGRRAVEQWMGSATVYVGASLYEPFGLSPLEAAAHGCALVLADIGSFRELWDGCADFFPPGDAAALAGRLEAFQRDPRLWRERGLAARERARHYSAERFGAEYQALYEEMCRQARVGSGAACG